MRQGNRRAAVASCGAVALPIPANVGANAQIRPPPSVEEVVSTRPVTGAAPIDFTWCAFVNGGKHVEYFLDPGARHGVTTIAGRRHLVQKMLDFRQRTL